MNEFLQREAMQSLLWDCGRGRRDPALRSPSEKPVYHGSDLPVGSYLPLSPLHVPPIKPPEQRLSFKTPLPWPSRRPPRSMIIPVDRAHQPAPSTSAALPSPIPFLSSPRQFDAHSSNNGRHRGRKQTRSHGTIGQRQPASPIVACICQSGRPQP